MNEFEPAVPEGKRIGRTLADWNGRVFVGRDQEVAVFCRMLEGGVRERVLNVYGTVGSGKSFLLEEFGRQAERRGALFLPMNGGWDFMHSPESFVQRLHRLLQSADPEAASVQPDAGAVIEALSRLAGRRKVVVAFDQYEQAGTMDGWLRDVFIPRLDHRVLVVLSGRLPLSGPWLLNPGWRQLLYAMPLPEFREQETIQFMSRHGVGDEEAIRHALVECRGNPLALSLLIAVSDPSKRFAAGTREPYIRQLVRHALDDIRDNELLELIRAASVIAFFNEDSLETVLGRSVGGVEFDRLVGLSYVLRTERGWTMHEVIREAVKEELRLRKPAAYGDMVRRCSALFLEEMAQGHAGADAAWKTVELMSYADNPLLRAHYRHSRAAAHFVEPLGEGNIEAAERYLIRRREQAKPTTVRCADAQSGTVFEYALTAEETLYRLSGLELRRWMALEPDAVKLLMDPDGDIVGLYVIVPIHRGTVEELRRSPVSQAFFRQAAPELLRSFQVAKADSPGWFIRTIDVADLANDSLRTANVRVMLEYALEGKLLLTSPPALDFYRDGHRDLGFEPIPGVVHYDYDGSTPTPTLLIDTRGPRRIDYLRRLLKLPAPALPGAPALSRQQPAPAPTPAPGMPAAPSAPQARRHPAFTEREHDVARLLLGGGTNAEIAARLYISEAAVKKHLNAMFQKVGVKNRTQLVKTLMDMP